MKKRKVFGLRPVLELLKKDSRSVEIVLFQRKEKGQAREGGHKNQQLFEQILKLSKDGRIPTKPVPLEDLESESGKHSHQGVMAIVPHYEYASLDDVLDAGKDKGINPALLLLDQVTDPQNFGSMLRSFHVLGGTGVIVTEKNCVSVTPTVTRVSAGATEHVPCAQVTNLARTIETLQSEDIWVYGTVEEGGLLPWQVDFKGPVALVMGNEQKGMRPLVQKKCDALITIPSQGQIASLNVAATVSAIFHEVLRQRFER